MLQEGGAAITRVISQETMNDPEKRQRKTISDVLHEMISSLSMKDSNNEISLLRVENDMVTSYFDNIGKFSDQFVTNFVEELIKDIDNLTLTLYSSSNELAIFGTYLAMLLRRLDHLSGAFFATLNFCKMLARKVVEDGDSPKDDFFIKHLFRCYLQIIREDP